MARIKEDGKRGRPPPPSLPGDFVLGDGPKPLAISRLPVTLAALCGEVLSAQGAAAVAAAKDSARKKKLILAFEVLNAERNGFLHAENIPPEIDTHRAFNDARFTAALAAEMENYLETVRATFRRGVRVPFPGALAGVALALGINGYGGWFPDDYENCKRFYFDLGARLRTRFRLPAVGVYLYLYRDEETGAFLPKVLADYRDWVARAGFDFIGLTWRSRFAPVTTNAAFFLERA